MEKDNIDKQKFDLLYESLYEIKKNLIDSAAKVTGFLLITMGWIITSDNAQNYLGNHNLFKYLMILVLASSYLLYLCTIVISKMDLSNSVKLIYDLNYIPENYYMHRNISNGLFLTIILGTFIICLLTGFLILQTKPLS